jgi:phosphate transport system substrate-binding protein
MKRVLAIASAIFAFTAAPLWADEKVVVGGSGGMTEEMQELAKAYMAKHPADKVEVIAEAMSTTGGIEGLKSGRLTIGLVTRAPKEDEKTLVYRVVGRALVGVGVHKSLPVAGLSEPQLCDVFGGRIKSWKEVGGAEGKITVVARKTDDNNEQTLRSKIGCFKDLKLTSDAVMLVRGNELMDAIDRRPGTIGIVSGGSVLAQRTNVKVLALAGVAASAENIQSGKYKFYNERGVITLGAPQGAAKRLLDFAATSEGQKILSGKGMIPVL